MAVARKAKEVPALKAEIKKGELTISKAERIISVVNAANQTEWIAKAKSLPKAEVEREVAKVNPEIAKREVIRRFDETSLRITLNLTEEAFAKLKRVQVLESTRQRKNVSLEEVISQMSELYIHHKDPVKKSERALQRGRKTPPSKGDFSSARLNEGILSKQEPQVQNIPPSQAELCPSKLHRDPSQNSSERKRCEYAREPHHTMFETSFLRASSSEQLIGRAIRFRFFWGTRYRESLISDGLHPQSATLDQGRREKL